MIYLSKPQKILLGLFLVIILINIFMWIFDIDIDLDVKRERFGFTKFRLEGIVTNKYLDKKNHNYQTLDIKTKDTILKYAVLHDKKTRLFDFIKINDSVFNDSASFEVRIKRGTLDTTILWRSSTSEKMYID